LAEEETVVLVLAVLMTLFALPSAISPDGLSLLLLLASLLAWRIESIANVFEPAPPSTPLSRLESLDPDPPPLADSTSPGCWDIRQLDAVFVGSALVGDDSSSSTLREGAEYPARPCPSEIPSNPAPRSELARLIFDFPFPWLLVLDSIFVRLSLELQPYFPPSSAPSSEYAPIVEELMEELVLWRAIWIRWRSAEKSSVGAVGKPEEPEEWGAMTS
jgi:hypothetical protein